MKKVSFKNLKSETLSDFQAYKLIENTPKSELLTPRKYELARTKEWVLFQKSKKKRTKEAFYIRRLCSLLSKQHKQDVEYYPEENKIIVDRFCYIIADICNNKEEYEFHMDKIRSPLIKRVISLRKSDFCNYFVLDTKSIRNYYRNEFKFPEWFKPLTKMRHFRIMDIRGRFGFCSRKYNDTTKSTMEKKLIRDLRRLDVGKHYYSLSRMLDVRLEAVGKGHPIDLLLLALDLDADCKNKYHLINELGICENCFKIANQKLKYLNKKIERIDDLEIYNTLFSGTKGFHIYLKYKGRYEVNEKEFLDVVTKLNENKKIIDEFVFERNGKIVWDRHRVMKTPNGIDATTGLIVKEFPLQRVNLKDEIVKPKIK